MANPWDNDPIVEAPTAPQMQAQGNPWDADPIVADDGQGFEQAPLNIDIVGGTRQSLADQQPQQAAVAPDGWNYGVGRDLAYGARSVLQGAGGLLGAAGGDAFNNYIVNPVARAVGMQEARPYREEAMALADRLGLPQAQTSGDRVLGDVGEALTGTGLTLGIGGGINALANMGRGAAAPATNQFAQFLTAQPVMQAASAAGGAGASSLARESGASQGSQLLAGLAGGLGPSALATGAGAALRGAVRGSSGEQMRNTLADFERLGATPSVGQASGNRMVQGVENLLAGGPTSAGVMNRFAMRQGEDIGAGLRNVADDLARNASGERAGRAIKRGIYDEGGFTDQFKRTQDELFSKVDEFIPPDRGVLLGNTRATLESLNNPIKSAGAPNTARLFRNGRISTIGNAVESDLSIPTQPQISLDEAVARVNQLYASRDAATQDAGRFAAFANDQANAANRYFPVAGQPRFPGRYTPAQQNVAAGEQASAEATGIARERVSQAAEIEQTLGDLTAAAQAAGGRLPYEAVKKLRTLVGQELQDAGLMSNFPRSKFKALYAALSEDLSGAAKEAGPAATAAYNRANLYTRAGMKRVEDIESVIDRAGGPEKVFQAAMAGTRDGGTTLRAVMQSLPQDGQKAVTSAVIKRMGLANPGAQDATGEAFSAATFLTNWNRVSPEAKRALFDRYGKDFSRDVDRIARVADNVKSGSQVFANPSGTANRAAAMTYGAALVGSLFTGGTAPLALSGIGANGVARILTSPTAVKWLARTTTMPRAAIPGTLNAMRVAGQESGDDALVELAGVLQQREQEVSDPTKNQ
ncbi:TPA: hypothetical protein QDZ75_004157 [Stenotrophomonas maltophilia]|nr:hypothetical protein [Stenotrophomonas maltophilia]